MTSRQDELGEEWQTRTIPDQTGIYQYLILVRAPGDPERKPRHVGGRADAEWYRNLRKVKPEMLKTRLLAHLKDGRERTFNRICVELFDKTADVVAGDKNLVEPAIWELVEKGLVEFRMETPIYFRITSPEG